jgi:hypothetical protein
VIGTDGRCKVCGKPFKAGAEAEPIESTKAVQSNTSKVSQPQPVLKKKKWWQFWK